MDERRNAVTQTTKERLGYSVKEAMHVSSLGRTRLYQLIKNGTLQHVKIGKRTVIKAASLHMLLEYRC